MVAYGKCKCGLRPASNGDVECLCEPQCGKRGCSHMYIHVYNYMRACVRACVLASVRA